MTDVSIVVPTRNNARTIEACVASARAQGPDVEVIVVDNHSDDGTAALAAPGADLVLLAGPERSAQRNRGLEASAGEIVVFIDSDMRLRPGLADELVELFADPAVGAAVVPEYAFGEGHLAACRALEKRLYLGVASAEAARGFRRDAFEQVGGYDETICAFEDFDLADRVLAAGWALTRTDTALDHDEGRVHLGRLWAKKRYYGRQWSRAAARQRDAGRTRRTGLRWRELVHDPVHVPGLAVLKAVDLTGLATGHLTARGTERSEAIARRGRPGPGRHAGVAGAAGGRLDS